MLDALWVEKYRPKTVDEYVFKDPELKNTVQSWIAGKSMSNVAFFGGAGTGKSSICKILLTELNVNDCDIMYANGSKECRKIEWVDKLISFCQTMPFGDFKVVYIDEFDFSNPTSVQPSLRNLMEEYSQTVRFMVTGNYPHKIIPALHSRFQTIKIEKSDPIDFTSRVATILVEENIEFDLDTLDIYVKGTYPDLRKCINELQLNSSNGKLAVPATVDSSSDYHFEMMNLFRSGKITEARKLLCSRASADEFESFYRTLYDNLDIFGDESKQDKAILIIKQGLVDHTICADPEINFSATCVRLAQLMV